MGSSLLITPTYTFRLAASYPAPERWELAGADETCAGRQLAFTSCWAELYSHSHSAGSCLAVDLDLVSFSGVDYTHLCMLQAAVLQLAFASWLEHTTSTP